MVQEVLIRVAEVEVVQLLGLNCSWYVLGWLKFLELNLVLQVPAIWATTDGGAVDELDLSWAATNGELVLLQWLQMQMLLMLLLLQGELLLVFLLRCWVTEVATVFGYGGNEL